MVSNKDLPGRTPIGGHQIGASTTRRTAIVVLGMHRSGTSALARVISLLGADLPQEIVPPVADNNAAGFRESERVFRLNEQLLASAGSKWSDWTSISPEWFRSDICRALKERARKLAQDEFGESPLFVLKDPRICRLLPFWRDVLHTVGCALTYIIPFRNPLEVAASLAARNRLAPAESQLLWLRHVLDAEFESRSFPRAFVSYHALFDDWRAAIAPVSSAIGIQWPVSPETAGPEIERFLDRRHRHTAISDEEVAQDPELHPWVKDAYSALLSISADGAVKQLESRLDVVRREFDGGCSALGPLLRLEKAGLATVVEERDALVGQIEAARGKYAAELKARDSAIAEGLRRLERTKSAHLVQISALQGQLSSSREKVATERHLRRDVEKVQRRALRRLAAIITSPAWQLSLPLRFAEAKSPAFTRGLALAAKLLLWTVAFKLPKCLRVRRRSRKVLQSGLFDLGWYIERYPEIVLQGTNPLLHWLVDGWREYRDPNPFFDTGFYLHQTPGLENGEVDPLTHFIEVGAQQGIDPSPRFDTDWYVARNSEVRALGMNPLTHYLRYGRKAGLPPKAPERLAGALPAAAGDSASPKEGKPLAKDAVVEDRRSARAGTGRVHDLRPHKDHAGLGRGHGDRYPIGDDIAQLQSKVHEAVSEAQLLLSAVRQSARWKIGNAVVGTMTGAFGPKPHFALDDLSALLKALDSAARRAGRSRVTSVRPAAPASATAVTTPDVARASHLCWRREAIPVRAMYSLPALEDSTWNAGISVVVLNRNGARLLENLLRSMAAMEWPTRWEAIVVDHGSEDESLAVLERFSRDLPLCVIALKENGRYGESNNRAVREARYPHLLLLNNDIILQHPGTIRDGLRALESVDVGMVGLKLLYPVDADVHGGNRMQHAGIRFRADFEHGFYRPHNLKPAIFAVPPGDVYRVAAVTAAAAFCRRDDYLALGGFHEEYDYGYEDVDLCLKFHSRFGRNCVVLNRLWAIHDESATQKGDERASVRARRLANRSILQHRFGYAIRRLVRTEKMRGEVMWSDDPTVVGFVVNEAHEGAHAGDYYTAMELGDALVHECGWEVRFLPMKNHAPHCFDVAGIDILIVMIDRYDLREIRNAKPGLLRIAWMRNWFDRWISRQWFDRYDLKLCSSRKAASYVEEHSGHRAGLLRIATNDKRFLPDPMASARDIDYCFTGSSRSEPREIEAFDPGRLQYRFAVFGRGWEGQPRFKAHWGGFAPYEVLPSIYRRSRIVIDDANRVTKRWGSLNSRVFDALASGALVITNGAEGAREVFGDLLPIYGDAEGLERELKRYLQEPGRLASDAAALRDRVLSGHTYRHRARELQRILIEFSERAWRFAIKVPAPRRSEAHVWGDYHFARSLARELTRAGHLVRIDLLPEWTGSHCMEDDVVLVLRGLSRYEPQPGQINLMWNISHPTKVDDDEYNAYDQVFVASGIWARQLAARLTVPVAPLLQCTDPEVCRPDDGASAPFHRLLFIGNSRQRYRGILRDAIDAQLPITVYGLHWEGLIPAELVQGEQIANEDLHKFYSRCGILLNDHWDDMREKGFLSNRLFDAAACGAVVVSDDIAGLRDVFHDGVTCYDGSAADLAAKVAEIERRPEHYRELARRAREVVLEGHTFAHRAQEILCVVEAQNARRVFNASPAPDRQLPSEDTG